MNGTPWTQLDICRREGYYEGKNETLFWRVDSRAGRTYLRVNQYAAIPKDRPEIIAHKKRRLQALRELISDLSTHYDVTPGKVSNKGVRESEVIIFSLMKIHILKLKKSYRISPPKFNYSTTNWNSFNKPGFIKLQFSLSGRIWHVDEDIPYSFQS